MSSYNFSYIFVNYVLIKQHVNLRTLFTTLDYQLPFRVYS